MVNSAADRDTIIRRLREELVGPSPHGEPIDCSKPIRFEKKEDSYPPHVQLDTGDEILQRDPPTARYGVGVLYPFETRDDQTLAEIVPEASRPEQASSEIDARFQDEIDRATMRIADDLSRGGSPADDGDFDVTTANAFEASSMAVTFLAVLPQGGVLQVEVTGGRYRDCDVVVAGKSQNWYLRQAVQFCAEISVDELRVTFPKKLMVPIVSGEDSVSQGLRLQVELLARPYVHQPDACLLTVSLVNRTPSTRPKHAGCLFQAHFDAQIVAPDGEPYILSYPGAPNEMLDEEEQSIALLYRTVQTFAVGHGCAADWSVRDAADRARMVSAECLPVCETPSVTPEIRRINGSPVEVPMASLAGLVPGDNGMDRLEEVISLYETWIEDQRARIESLAEHLRPSARLHLAGCTQCVDRMRDGLDCLKDGTALRAFQLANHAMLLQQICASYNREPRRGEIEPKEHRLTFSRPYLAPDPLAPPPGVGSWRPFQVAFLLMTLRSAVDGEALDRQTVELIWFPTGGGKTEAYLGLTAFSLFMRRLRDPQDIGVNVLMRYTLRLLTAQQFQRASSLIAAMEILRRDCESALGESPFSIGIWLGQNTTPNTRADARSMLRDLQKGKSTGENKLLLRQCPWCGAQMGAVEHKGTGRGQQDPIILGYEISKQTVVFRCPDKLHCPFGTRIPVYVVDEDIYEDRPSLVIGTVDKFAMLAWRPEARTMFGLDARGERRLSPPGLIIQDELHLIAGPLGSMVGLFEPVIEELCTDRRGGKCIPPKIVSSTATIRRYGQQIKALYARDDVVLFPPPGLDAGDSFFGRYARNPDGSLAHGRMYLGVNAPGLGSQLTAVVRSFSSLLQNAYELPAEARDPWWTLMVFFNTLRELGTSLSLFQSDIPDYMVGLRNRTGKEMAEMRFPRNILELTGRIRNEDVPRAIEQLEVKALSADPRPVDVCLASSIIEVGIDVDRLSLMAVVSQPKTTSQYIQVTGRIGRRWAEHPGLVVTIYSPSRPRDRSHFEKFRSYHEKLYAQVEPTSVTPFSPPALERSLHAAMIAHIRQTGPVDLEPYPFPEEQVDRFVNLMSGRVQDIAADEDEVESLDRVLAKRTTQWQQWEPRRWRARQDDLDPGLMYASGEYILPEWRTHVWPVQQSLRTVDAQCEGTVTSLYLNHDEAPE